MEISIIIPAYQAENTIMRCISSILNQTFQDYEIIVVNDGSTDNTKNILESLKENISKFKVIHQENMGAMDARINGMLIAQGEYILFLDSDDWLAANALELLNKVAISENSDVILFHAYIVSGQAGYPIPMYTASLEVMRNDSLRTFFNRGIAGFICGKMVKLSFIKDNCIAFPQRTSYGEDLAMFYSIFLHKPTISCCNEYLYFYVKVDKAIPDYCVDIIKSVEFVGEQLIKHGLYREYEDDYQLFGTRYTIEIYNTIINNPLLQQQLWSRYKQWNLNYFGSTKTEYISNE